MGEVNLTTPQGTVYVCTIPDDPPQAAEGTPREPDGRLLAYVIARLEDTLQDREETIRYYQRDLDRYHAEAKRVAARLRGAEDKIDELDHDLRAERARGEYARRVAYALRGVYGGKHPDASVEEALVALGAPPPLPQDLPKTSPPVTKTVPLASEEPDEDGP